MPFHLSLGDSGSDNGSSDSDESLTSPRKMYNLAQRNCHNIDRVKRKRRQDKHAVKMKKMWLNNSCTVPGDKVTLKVVIADREQTCNTGIAAVVFEVNKDSKGIKVLMFEFGIVVSKAQPDSMWVTHDKYTIQSKDAVVN